MADSNNQKDDPLQYPLPVKKERVVQPLSDTNKKGDDLAANVVRQKLERLYESEPDAKEELQESEAAGTHRSKHQKFMHDLSTSGKSLAEIQTAWHNYYVGLPDQEKHEVWQEFYSQHSHINHNYAPSTNSQAPVAGNIETTKQDETSEKTVSDIKQQILQKVQSSSQKKKKAGPLHSMLFGLGMGSLVLAVTMFGFFNERFIAPLITPSRSVSNTPLIIDPEKTEVVDPLPKVIIPKINIEVPVIFDETSIDEAAVQRALEQGVLHYPITELPGEKGNGVLFGHSSNNILNSGKYKFAFVLLRQLENGDVFYVQKDGKRYAYKVFHKKVVPPTDLSVLEDTDKPATMTLITCDPPGTAVNRLVVVGEQISPDPATNLASSAKTAETVEPDLLPKSQASCYCPRRVYF